MLLNPNSYIIFGAGGQDGIYLTKELIKKNKKIIFISNTIKKKHLDESITNYNKIEFIKLFLCTRVNAPCPIPKVYLPPYISPSE